MEDLRRREEDLRRWEEDLRNMEKDLRRREKNIRRMELLEGEENDQFMITNGIFRMERLDLAEDNEPKEAENKAKLEEWQKARNLLIDGLKGHTLRGSVISKSLGSVEEKPVKDYLKMKKCRSNEFDDKVSEILYFWNQQIRNPDWKPFKTIMDGDAFEVVIDEEDEMIKLLKRDYDEGVYMAVIRALNEMEEFNPTKRTPLQELWNIDEQRKAKLEEGVEFVFKTMEAFKGKK